MKSTITIPTRPARIFLPEEFKIDSWKTLEPFLNDLKNRKINSVQDLEQWLLHRSELESVLEEDLAWRYIKMNIDTSDKTLSDSYEFFITEIQPNIIPYGDELNRKLVGTPFIEKLDKDKYFIYLRGVKKEIELYREENIPLYTKLSTESQKYGSICAAMTVEIDGKEMTLQQAARILKETDRSRREMVFHKLNERRSQDVEKLDELFNELIKLRQQVAKNAGYKNYRDYKFEELGRFDYGVQDCYDFHQSIAKEIAPITENFDKERKEALGLDELKPWDLEVDISGKQALKPFETGEELLQKSIDCFYRIHPYFGECLEIMKEMGHLDLESRKGKAPGGFNYPLYEIGVPFIYMNSAGTLRDVITMVHEGGHAIHSFLSRDLELASFKSVPSEVAELASMSMELISMEYWDTFFDDKEELKRAKREQLEKALDTLPWVATIDKFQHWIYENPEHTVEERTAQWLKVKNEFGSKYVNWKGNEKVLENMWQKQLHLYEVPFYYIEYGMAQLGAIAMWRNFKQNPSKTIEQYMAALKLGYTRSIGELYETAGIRFDFSRSYVKELADFVKAELKKLD